MMFKVGMISLGCPKNQVDGEMMLSKLNKNGFQIVANIEDSDVMVINTCGFIESAKTEAIETILEVAEYKKAGLISAVVVTGCLAERYQDEILKEIPEVDAVIGIGADADIVKTCQKALVGVKTSNYPDKCYLPLNDERLISTPSHWAYLKLSDGCDNRCSYCAIPLIRGGYRERAMESILDEARMLAANGVKELILIAQDTTKYGKSIYKEYKLAELLKQLCKINGIEWIRLFYCYPDRVTDELIEVIASEEKICSYIDIPLQHCNGEILKSMNRFGSYDSLKELLLKMKNKIPNLSLRTTFMVGFPGETEEQFEELCRFVKDIKFDKMGCFAYSAEEDTPAYEFDNQIDEDIKKKRADVLMDIQYTITEEANKSRVGNTYKVIVDEKDGDKYIGRSYLDSPEIDSGIIFISDTEIPIGSFVDVKITDYDGYDLIGER
ncbi:MAG: 30S ribosomal protein S12 methylthiotransferase RimO, partial [Eubacterium sp.]|nr:30S ribosomal protein S12 methylthiotransferase RimO [Eubacterium sp.]